MSSLRLALKQSLQETGHLAPKEKKKKKSAPRRGRQPRQPGEPPRKRGRPPKHSRPPVAEPPKEDRDNDDKEEDEDGSENEFSYDSEASHEEHEDQEGEEDENEDEEEDKEQPHNRSRHSEQDADAKGDPDDNDEANEYRGRKKNKKLRSKQQEEINASDEERQTQRKILKKELKHSAANKIQIHWKKKRAASVDERKAKKGEESQEMEANSSSHQVAEKQLKRGSPTKEKISTTQTLGKKKKEKGTVPPPTPEVLEWARNISERKCRKHITSGMRVKVSFL